jgi:hypothetical protein
MWDRTERALGGRDSRSSRMSAGAIGRLLAIGMLLVAALAACTKAPASSSTRTVTITASGAASDSSSASASASPSPSPTQPATPMTKFSGTCYSLLTLYDVQRTAGYPIGGKTAFVVGVPDKTLGRLTYLNCRYGLPATPPGGSATPQIEINVALYGTAADAAKRAASTVSDYVANGATPAQVTIADNPGTILVGGTGAGYSVPLLVASSGQRTVAVSLNKGGLPSTRRTQILSDLGALALTNTAS